MVSVREALRRAVDLGLRTGFAERGALRSAAGRGRGIAMIWHRIGPEGPQPHEAVPTLATAAFAAQLDLLAELGDIVPLAELEQPAPRQRPRIALTFDDDDAGHVAHALPQLRARGLPATFFLSGRWRHGFGPYWWELVERDVQLRGATEVARGFGLDGSLGVREIVRALTGTPAAAKLAERARTSGESPMVHEEAVALVEAGMEIGFHTVDHDVLTSLGEREQAEVLVRGREELARDLGVPLVRLAYPHGLADVTSERAAAWAGYVSAWTTSRHVVHPGVPPMKLGRWDLGHLPLDRLRSTLVRGLVRPHP